MESKILISKGNISLRLMNNTKKDMKFLLNWLTNEQVVRWVYEEGAPWDMNKTADKPIDVIEAYDDSDQKSILMMKAL